MTAAPTVASAVCPQCETDVPDGNFCGYCGCHLAAEPGDGSPWWRPRTFGAAPAEAVLRPYLASSLFPQLPSGSRRPFRLIIVIAMAGLLAAALLRMPALGIALSAFALPLLFLFYLRASGADRDLPRTSLILAALLGVLLGTAWVLVSGAVVARTYGVPMSVGLALHQVWREGFGPPAAGMLLMILPTVLVRLLRPPSRDCLDGFMIGALGALAFAAASTVTRLSPQIFGGLVAHGRPVDGLVVEAVLCGVTVPISAAAAGGMVGVALWFRRGGAHSGRVGLVLGLLAAAVLLAHGALGVVDILGLPEIQMATSHTVVMVLALLALRFALQLALLHESHDPIERDQPLLCTHCEHVVPDMAFCPACGVATRASSRESRRERRGPLRPRRIDADGVPPDSAEGVPEKRYAGYALPSATYAAPALQRPRFSWLMGRWGIGVTSAAVVLAAAALVLTPKIAHYMCPPDCGRPPTGTPVTSLPRFSAPDGQFSVAYPAPGSAYVITTESSGVTARFTGGDGGVMQFFSEPANGRSARDIARAVVRKAYPNAKLDYEIPNAMVGYQPGYGEIADAWPQNTSATYSRVRIVVTAAIKNDLALIAFATGPYHPFGPDFGPGPPSGANLQLAQDMGKYVNSFRWRGDPPR